MVGRAADPGPRSRTSPATPTISPPARSPPKAEPRADDGAVADDSGGANPWKVQPRRAVVEDRHRRSAAPVAGAEIATGHDRDPKRAKECRRDDAHVETQPPLVGGRKHFGVTLIATDRVGEVRQRQSEDRAGGLDVRARRHAGQHSLDEEGAPVEVLVGGSRQRHRDGLDAARINPERRPQEPEEAAPKQPGGHQERHRKRNLDGDENTACANASAIVRRARAGGERAIQIARGAQRRQQAKQARGGERRHASEEDHGRVHPCFVEHRDACRLQSRNQAGPDHRQHQAGEPARTGQQHAFDEQTAEQPEPRRAEGGTDSDFAAPPERHAQHQARDIDAGHEKDEANGAEEQPHSWRDFVADDTRAQRRDRDARAFVGAWMLFREAVRNRGQVRARGREARRRTEPADDRQVVSAALARDVVRRQHERRPSLAAERKVHRLRHDADDFAHLPVEHD